MSVATKPATIREFVASRERLSASFHMVNRVLPDDPFVLWVPPDMLAREALALMSQRGYSQLPVKQGDSVLGLFTYRAFALEVAKIGGSIKDPSSLPVEEFLSHDKPALAQLTDEFRSLVDLLEERDSVVVSGPENLIGILTPMDVLRHLVSVADAFVLIEEIEFALRTLIRNATPEREVFETCVTNALSTKYDDKQPPQQLEDMTFDDYIAILRDGRNWPHYVSVFGGTRERMQARLDPVRDLRNVVFHFRRELSIEDHEQLSICRDWLLRCVRKVDAQRRGPQ